MSRKRALLNVESYDIALDWITLSSFSAPVLSKEFDRFAYNMQKTLLEEGEKREEARVRGYRGYKFGDIHFLERAKDGHLMITASGNVSNRIAQEAVVHGIPAKATRIDIAATATAKAPDGEYPRGLAQHIERVRREEGQRLLQAMGRFNCGDGHTGITIGSRVSAFYGRIYAHDIKHKTGTRFQVWRHEVEYKGQGSFKLWEEFRQSSDRRALLEKAARHRLEKWRIPCDWLKEKELFKVNGTKAPTTDEGRLEYLKKVIFPMIVQLRSDGHEEALRDLIKAHGLQDLFVL